MKRLNAMYQYVTDLVSDSYRYGEEPSVGDWTVVKIPDFTNDVPRTEGHNTNEVGTIKVDIYTRKEIAKGQSAIDITATAFDILMTEVKQSTIKEFNTDTGKLSLYGLDFVSFFDASEEQDILFLTQFDLRYKYTE